MWLVYKNVFMLQLIIIISIIYSVIIQQKSEFFTEKEKVFT